MQPVGDRDCLGTGGHAELFISPKTASVHVSNILGTLGVAPRTEAAAVSYRLHLLDDR